MEGRNIVTGKLDDLLDSSHPEAERFVKTEEDRGTRGAKTTRASEPHVWYRQVMVQEEGGAEQESGASGSAASAGCHGVCCFILQIPE